MTSHRQLARRVGVPQAQIAALLEGGVVTLTDAERAAVRFAEELTLTPAGVADRTFEELRRHWGEAQIVEIAALTGLLNYFNRFNNVLQIEPNSYPEEESPMTDTKSPVEFPTQTRVHVALNVRSLDASVAFYEKLFGQAPTKVRRGYAKFEVLEPALNLALNEHPAARSAANHFGIQVKSREAVEEARIRLRARGLEIREEGVVNCCYALQEKFWTTDPDGNEWETFVVLEADAKVCCA